MKPPLFRAVPAAFLCAALTLLGLSSAPHASAQSVVMTGNDCANITVLGLRGSDAEENRLAGKWQSKEPPADKFGFVNTKSISSFEKMLPDGTTVKNVTVPYVPATVDSYTRNAGEVAEHKKGVDGAKALIVSTVADTLRDCPQTKLVVIGYGQGAEAAHQAASMIPADQQDSLGAVWLISDPLLNAKDTNQFRYYGEGVTSTVSGAMIDIRSQAPEDSTRAFRSQLAPKDTTFPAFLSGKVVSVCSHYDYNCESHTGAMAYDPTVAYSTSALIGEPGRFVATALTKLCNDVTFFAARGSGEPFYGKDSGYPVANDSEGGFATTDSDYKQGFGTVLATMARAIESKFPWGGGAPTFGHVPVDYEAVDVAKAVSLNSGYPRSVNTGIDPGTGPEQFRQLIKECPNTKVILLGYSQGGHVIHEITMRLTEEERKHISMAILVADAIRNPEDNGSLTFMGRPLQFETTDSVIFNGMGAMRMVALADTVCLASNALTESTSVISAFFRVVNFITAPLFCAAMPEDVRFSDVVSPDKFPDDLHYKVLNVCSSLDIICDTEVRSDGATLGFDGYKAINLVGLLKDTSVHGEFYKRPGFYDFPASWAAGKLTLPPLNNK